MQLQHLFVGLAATVAAGTSQAVDVVLVEGFNNVPNLASTGWVQVNNSSVPAGTDWFQGNPGIFDAAAGAADSYAAANFLATGAASGAVSSWLISPLLTLNSSSELIFFVRTAGEGYIDTLEARFSSNGASTDVGTTTSSVGDFTTLLRTYSSNNDVGWLGFTYTFSGLSGDTSGRIAFRYVVDDIDVNGNYVGLDSVFVTGVVPEPATYLLFAIGLTGLLLRRRLAA